MGQPATPAYRKLSSEIGYADLTGLVPGEVDPMFAAFKGTRGLILDMRGYPRGTAWAIAPHLNVKQAKVGARFRRPPRGRRRSRRARDSRGWRRRCAG